MRLLMAAVAMVMAVGADRTPLSFSHHALRMPTLNLVSSSCRSAPIPTLQLRRVHVARPCPRVGGCKLMMNMEVGEEEEEEEEEIEPYVGPSEVQDKMKFGCFVQDLGIEIFVGPSKVCHGMGLYVAVAASEHVAQVTLPAGTLISGYSKEGSWSVASQGDKAVAYAFDRPDTLVVYERELMSLIDAAGSAAELSDNITEAVAGHNIFFDEGDQDLKVEPDVNWAQGRFFVPLEDGGPAGPTNFGMFANDLAFEQGISQEKYASNTNKNILQLVWRMAVQEGKLAPTWPVVFLNQPVCLQNAEPMEIGLTYGWRYWENLQSKGDAS
eukprot:753111-Hanusia_phi.AAC.3